MADTERLSTIRLTRSAAPVTTWTLLELQGHFEFDRSDVQSIGGVEIGEYVAVPSTSGSPAAGSVVLTIGNNVIRGKKMALKKNLSIFRKVDSMECDGAAPELAYELVGTADSKVVFRNRPTTLLTKDRPSAS